MKAKPALLILLSALGIFFSCNKSTLEDLDLVMGYEYFPLEVGQSRHYAVDSIIFDPSVQGIVPDTSFGFFREDVVDTLRDNTGALVFRIERYYRQNSADPWQIHSVVSSSRGEREAVYTENNLRFIKLRFPLQDGLEWDGTAYFPDRIDIELAGESIDFYKGWDNTVVERRAEFQLNGQSVPDVYVVRLADLENNIQYRSGYEVYAAGKGLIYQEIQVMDSQCEFCCNGDLGYCITLPWVEKAEKGLILKKRLLD
ncbi:hypothetical protein [Flavilitoribacter nigricans]|uniref:Uncharacterized protein n=1 Tax=Flavilitoribacter nigricans (strain ATCC 23147 / DSM 23189 / NBRC 102662 / NCIMB 1420 / SS-2) TaxID=1122177 RepID=A0A2D0NE07_FLAN2|nr:hypothetical protein [Flavilitoribacter nigricans]PHN06606.1 hypothetical protein CRP01_09910 [Flavilitoribacter nigricans DSM 23189 = NBRC 102662]